MGRRPVVGIAYIQAGGDLLASSSHFHNPARSCADSDWRSSANQGRGSLFRHTGCVLDIRPRSTTRGLRLGMKLQLWRIHGWDGRI
jgi:hypothetical protein